MSLMMRMGGCHIEVRAAKLHRKQSQIRGSRHCELRSINRTCFEMRNSEREPKTMYLLFLGKLYNRYM